MPVSDTIDLHTNTETIYGITYGEWTTKWWQWALSTPRSVSPLLDETGHNWNTVQPFADVYFLAGILGDIHNKFPFRKIKMDFGRSILIPVLNCAASFLEYPQSEDA